VLDLAQSEPSDRPRSTKEATDKAVREYIGLAGKNRTKERTAKVGSELPSDWTGQDFPLGSLMCVAAANPEEFCTLLAAAFLRPPTKWQRGLAERRAWERREQAAGRML
jgi:hypothetical protein